MRGVYCWQKEILPSAIVVSCESISTIPGSCLSPLILCVNEIHLNNNLIIKIVNLTLHYLVIDLPLGCNHLHTLNIMQLP